MKHEMDLEERRREHEERMEERRRAEELHFEDRMHRMMSCFLQQAMGFSLVSPPPAGTAFSHQPIPHDSSPNRVYHNSYNKSFMDDRYNNIAITNSKTIIIGNNYISIVYCWKYCFKAFLIDAPSLELCDRRQGGCLLLLLFGVHIPYTCLHLTHKSY